MKQNTLRGLALGLATMSVLCINAQSEALVNSLADLFATADASNTSISAHNTAITEARLKTSAARAQRLPEINTQLSLSYLGNAQLWNRHFGEYMKAEMPHFGNNFSFQAMQTIYSGGAISGGIRLAELGETMASLRSEAASQEVHLLLASLYMDLHSLNNQQEVVAHNIALADTLISKTRERHAEGVVLGNDITRYELMRQQMQLQATVLADRKSILRQQLMTALGTSDNAKADVQMLPVEAFDVATIPTEDQWQALALNGNNGIKQTSAAIDIRRQEERLARAERLPKIALVAEDHLDGPITIEVPPINKNLNYWFVGVGVNYNVSSLFKSKKKVEAAKTAVTQAQQLRQATREGVADAVHAAYVNLGTARTELTTRLKSMQLARQNYDVISARYQEGLALVTDMTDAANLLLDAELQHANARIAVASALYRLKYVAGDI